MVKINRYQKEEKQTVTMKIGVIKAVKNDNNKKKKSMMSNSQPYIYKYKCL